MGPEVVNAVSGVLLKPVTVLQLPTCQQVAWGSASQPLDLVMQPHGHQVDCGQNQMITQGAYHPTPLQGCGSELPQASPGPTHGKSPPLSPLDDSGEDCCIIWP